ncbi:MAG: F0F1 ATP synthase subunit delta [Prevotella sp.]|jgi:F-type H+-transporting ATPase subunit delta|nr:F0F1 ATP synthase subunit delta [Prevotella sp.]MCH4182463.1 F0F1 ATP synthase subunit delta [Prevotella sp.]MCH4212510.1 F0F1 ATP synthase subunit delta [Prevotella sp.]MCH4240553.1 F0F1 ATP synthase subunit delta [Prevotella sp.]
MDLGVISVRYARALIKGATALKVEDQVYEEMLSLYQSYFKVHDLKYTIDNPMLVNEKKQHLLETAMGGNPSELSKNFVALVLKEGRESSLQLMAASYISLYRQQKNITSGILTTAVPVSSAIEQRMQKLVESRTNGTVEFKTETDPDIIGGFILEYDTYRMDASVKTMLRTVYSQLYK